MRPHVTQIVKCYDQGVTFPFLCQLSDARLAVIKYPHNAVGSYVLINEYIAYCIAKKLNLAVPECGCCDFPAECSLTNDFLEQWYQIPDMYSTKGDIGASFYSELIPKTVPLSAGLVSSLENRAEFIKLVLFDHIISNVDRHEGNLMITLAPRCQFFIIDHSSIFCCSHQWTANLLGQRMEQRDYDSNELLQNSTNNKIYDLFWPCCPYTVEEVRRAANEIHEALPPEFVHTMICSVPEEWRDYISHEDWIAMEQYLNYRISHLDNIVNVIARERGMI